MKIPVPGHLQPFNIKLPCLSTVNRLNYFEIVASLPKVICFQIHLTPSNCQFLSKIKYNLMYTMSYITVVLGCFVNLLFHKPTTCFACIKIACFDWPVALYMLSHWADIKQVEIRSFDFMHGLLKAYTHSILNLAHTGPAMPLLLPKSSMDWFMQGILKGEVSLYC
jgi:hypothetical protein